MRQAQKEHTRKRILATAMAQERFDPLSMERIAVAAGVSPGGLEDFFAELGIPAADRTTPPVVSGPPDMGHMAAIARKHGLEIVGPPVQ